MINLKWGLFAAAGAFVISFGVGLIFGVAMIHIFLRALLFAAIFFGIGFGIKYAVNNYLPEVLSANEEYKESDIYEQQKGRRVDITLDTTGEYAVPELFKSPGTSDELGNIEDLVSGRFRPSPPPHNEGIDRNREERYNQEVDFDAQEIFSDLPEMEQFSFQSDPSSGNVSGYEEPAAEKPVVSRQDFNPSFGDGSDGLGGLPDLDTMAMAFSPSGAHSSNIFSPGDSFGSSYDSDDSEEGRPGRAGNKPQTLQGDFNPKDLAEGIRTVLSKEK